MRKFKETITALIGAGGIGAVSVRRTGSQEGNVEALGIFLDFLTKVAIIAAAAAAIIFLDIWKLLALLVFGFFYALILRA